MPRVRLDGGIIGSLNTPTTSVASGIWTVKDNEEYTRRGLWPSQGYPVGSINATMLIVAGGGGGGYWNAGVNNGGGGGAGGLYFANVTLSTGTSGSIIIGAGGAGGTGSTAAPNGSNTTAFGYSTLGGGGGGGDSAGANGGSGGGGGGTVSVSRAGGSSTQSSTFGYGLGNAGGNNAGNVAGGAGGGGGAGAVGSTAGTGGAGAYYSISGSNTAYAGGGAGWGSGGAAATGGVGGGANSSGSTAIAGSPSTGGGGGGVNGLSTGGNGGSGVVIVSYPLPQQFTGGIVTNINGTNVVHTFTSSANLTALTTPIDTYQPYNTLLLHADGSNGANNSVFLDSSTNNLSITKTGTPTQGTFSPFSTTGWSNYFNTSSDSYGFPSTAGMALGASGNATIECWAYFSALPASGATIFNKDGANGTNYPEYAFYFTDGSGTLNLEIGVSTSAVSYQIIPFGVIKTGTWYHIAACRTGTTWTLFLNGSIVNTVTQTITPTASTNSFYVGNQLNGGGGALNGAYISNLRVIVGSTLYTSNFSPPLTALTNVTNTVVLTSQNNKFVENINNGTITVTGTPQVQPFSPFNPTAAYSNTVVGGSMYFNGTTDYIQATVSAAPGTGDFTMEGWVYFSAFSSGSPNIFSLIAASSSSGFQVFVSSAGIGVRSNSANIILATGSPKVGQWYHIALVRNSGTITLYSNGVSIGSTATAYTFSDTQFNSGWTPVGQYFGGYVSNIRYSNTAIYTATFTPPTAPFKAISSTVLLVNGTNAGIIDSSQKIDLSTYGSAAISTTQSKFGGTSMYFDGSTGYVRAPHNAMLDLSTGAPNFTVECWFYTFNNTAQASIVSKDWNQGTTNPSYGIFLNPAQQLLYMIADGTSGSTYNYYTYTGIAINTWYHVALVRNGSNMLSFLNGNLVNTQTISITTKDVGTTFNIGTNNNTGNYFNGYIDEVRITKGIARYTSNFTPQTSAFLNT